MTSTYNPGSRHIETRPAAGGFVALIVSEQSRYPASPLEVVEWRSGVFPTEEDAEAAASRELDMRKALRRAA